jgi:L-rhamnose mutarotase
MQIYRSGTHLIMVMSVDESFSFEDKGRQDSQNPKVIEWERLMTQFQLVDDADSHEKRRVVANVFNLQEHI